MYINNHTYFSLRYGILKPRELLEMVQSISIKALALTDINNTSAELKNLHDSKFPSSEGIKGWVRLPKMNKQFG